MVPAEKPATKQNKYGYLTSIKEYNESQENMMTEQTTSPSRQIEFTSLRCDENGTLELNNHEESSDDQPELAPQIPTLQQNEISHQSHNSSVQCEENFGSQSPIKQFHVEEN